MTEQKGEELWFNYLSKTHTNITTAPNYKFYDWDVKGDYKGNTYTYEVKYDAIGVVYAEKYSRPVNLYIEFRNTTQNEDSGILASKADYYVYIFDGLYAVDTAYIFNRAELLHHIKGSVYKVVGNSLSGDDNALGWLVPLPSVKQILKQQIQL